VEEILLQLQARQEHTYLPFLVLIMQLCDRTRVPFWGKTDVRITLVSSSIIRRIEAEYLQDNAAQRKRPPSDSSTHALSVEQTSTSTPSSTIGPSVSIFVPHIFAVVFALRPSPSSFYHPSWPRPWFTTWATLPRQQMLELPRFRRTCRRLLTRPLRRPWLLW